MIKKNSMKPVKGLMAVGEAACVSVHGANRLGSNSLLDLVVFGRAAALKAKELLANKSQNLPQLSGDALEKALDRFDKTRFAKGESKAADVRLKMQKTMQQHAAVFRTEEIMAAGIEKNVKYF